MCSVPAEPYGRKRDAAILALAEADELRVSSPVGHTLYVRILTKFVIVALYIQTSGRLFPIHIHEQYDRW